MQVCPVCQWPLHSLQELKVHMEVKHMTEHKPPYISIMEIKQAIDSGLLDASSVGTFNCKGELFINDRTGKTLFSAYYNSSNACSDVCALLGLDEPEHV